MALAMDAVDTIPLISFVVPCYNYARYLPDCLDGIFSQQGGFDYEVIAVDDGSKDNTLEVLGRHASPRLRVIAHEKNQGHIVTVNRGLREARGKYVVRVDPDDRHRGCFLTETVPILERHPEVGLVFGDVALINERGEITLPNVGSEFGAGDRKGNELTRILRKNYICAPTVIARREAWMEAWPVPDGLAFNDWYFNVMLARRHEYYYRDKVLADYRVHGANHHHTVVVNKTEEPSVMWVLKKVYSEVEADPALESAKRTAKHLVYASHYQDFARKYFSVGHYADSRRCYLRAASFQPTLLLRAEVLRHLFGTFVGKRIYESCKAGLRWVEGRCPTPCTETHKGA
jgi:glycosyltransferase involved in cell wall biosynthesis